MRRVVVTGLGMVTPLANGVEATWSRILAGQSGAGLITRFDENRHEALIVALKDSQQRLAKQISD